MPGHKLLFLSTIICSGALLCNTAKAQVSFNSEGKRTSIYLSVGTSSPTYNPSTINITQGNTDSYDLEKVKADNKTAPSGAGLKYNLRAGIFFNRNQTMAVELNYDPLSYHVVDGQSVHQTGLVGNHNTDSTFTFADATGHSYYMNGANSLMINFVYRYQLYRSFNNNIRLDVLGKAGIGPVMPHTLNTISGKTAEHPQFQLAGFNAGLEAAFRLTLLRHIFIEAAPKYTYGSYTDIPVYNGTATQKLTTFQVVFSAGYWFSITRHNPLFQKKKREYRALTIRPIHPQQEEDEAPVVPEPSGE